MSTKPDLYLKSAFLNLSKDSRFFCNLWELQQIMILRANSKIVGTHIFRNSFSFSYARVHVKIVILRFSKVYL